MLHQMDHAVIDRDDESKVRLLDDAIDARRTVLTNAVNVGIGTK